MANTLLDDLVEHWSFDNTANGSEAYNMTLVNSPSYVTDSPGAWTQCLALNGSSQYSYTADGAQWDVLAGTGEWSVGFWIKHSSVSGTQFYMNDWSSTASDRSWIAYLSSSTPILRVEVSDVAKDATWGSTISAGTWYCVQVWRSGDTTYMDINNTGSPVSVALGASASIDPWSNVLAFGARALSPTSYFAGRVQALSVWGADIGATNRTEFYQSGSGLAYGSWSASGGSNATRAILENLQVPHLVRPGVHTLTR